MAQEKFSNLLSVISRLLLVNCLFRIWIDGTSYISGRNIRNSHINTTCILLNYTVYEKICKCGFICADYQCFDEEFFISYFISNGSYITSNFQSLKRTKKHTQTQVCMNK